MTLRDANCYRELADQLLELAARRTLIYVRNPGNWGDALIGAGERAFFQHFSIPIVEVWPRYIHRRLAIEVRVRSRAFSPTVVYGGNGALSGPYFHLHNRIRLLLTGTKDSVLLPSTLPVSIDRIGLPRKMSLWRRDETLSLACNRNSRFCHDMAFFLDPEPVQVSQESGDFFREDAEATVPGKVPQGNHDISNQGDHRSPIKEFFNKVGQYRVVNTDRLHVGIAAALLGRRVNLYANNYGKIQAIYEASIAPNYPNVTFLGTRSA